MSLAGKNSGAAGDEGREDEEAWWSSTSPHHRWPKSSLNPASIRGRTPERFAGHRSAAQQHTKKALFALRMMDRAGWTKGQKHVVVISLDEDCYQRIEEQD